MPWSEPLSRRLRCRGPGFRFGGQVEGRARDNPSSPVLASQVTLSSVHFPNDHSFWKPLLILTSREPPETIIRRFRNVVSTLS